jgi:hypothetical protein
VAVTGGVNRFPPVGLMLFSVLDGVVVVLEGPPFPPPPHAVNVPIETTAAMPTIAATRRVTRGVFMRQSCLCCELPAVNLADYSFTMTVFVAVNADSASYPFSRP